MFLSCHIHVSEWIYNLQLPKSQGNPSSKQVEYLSLSNSNKIRSHNYLIRKRIFFFFFFYNNIAHKERKTN